MSDFKKKECFGLSWNGGDVKCSGGLDPVYTNPKARSPSNPNGDPKIPVHRRDQCVWYTQCAHQTNFNKMRGYTSSDNSNKSASQQTVAPRSQVVRPTAPSTSTPVHQQWHQPAAPVQPQWVQPQPQPQWVQPPQWAHPQQWAPPYIVGQGPQVVPMPFQQPGAQMPGYITVPEPIDPQVPGWLRFLIMLVRSAGKAVFHTGSHLMDHEPFIRYQQPAPPAPPPEKK